MANAARLYVNDMDQILAGAYGGSAALIAYGVAHGYDTFQYYDIQSVLPAQSALLNAHIIAARLAGIQGHIPVGSQSATVRTKVTTYNALYPTPDTGRFFLKGNDGINAEDYDTGDPGSTNEGEWYTLSTGYQITAFNNLMAGMALNKTWVETTQPLVGNVGMSSQTYIGWFSDPANGGPPGQQVIQSDGLVSASLQYPNLLPGEVIGGLQVHAYRGTLPPTVNDIKGYIQTRLNYLADSAFAIGRKLPINIGMSAENLPGAIFQGNWFSPVNTPLVYYNTYIVPAFAAAQAAVPSGNGNSIYLQGYFVFKYTDILALIP
jgi:hypothetical protein